MFSAQMNWLHITCLNFKYSEYPEVIQMKRLDPAQFLYSVLGGQGLQYPSQVTCKGWQICLHVMEWNNNDDQENSLWWVVCNILTAKRIMESYL